MKNVADIQTRLKAELNQWVTAQCKNIYDDYYLYYLPTTPEHIGGILICKEPPANPEYQLADGQRLSKDATVNQNFNRLREVCNRLPILEV
jgi:hypothetical protein